MTVIVTDAGFAADDFTGAFVPLAEAGAGVSALELGPADHAEALAGRLEGVGAIRVLFPAFNDGRGFTIARRLRSMGFTGRLRAAGHVLSDQYAMARRCGFDEVEIGDDLAARQPQDQWQFRADWGNHFYQGRLRA